MFSSIKTKIFLVISTGFFVFVLSLFPRTSSALTITPRLEINSDPGVVVHTTIKVTNEERQTKTYFTRYENFNAFDETGNPKFNSRREDLAIWIKTPVSLTLGPGESIDMPVDIDIPANADPGGHYAAIFFETDASSNAEPESNVALAQRLGSLILLRVNGNFTSNANILEFGTSDKKIFYTQLPIQFYFRLQNTGDDHQTPVGEIQINNILGSGVKVLDANAMQGSVLPKSVRKFLSTWTEAKGSYKQDPVIDMPKTDKMPYWDAVNFQARHFLMGRYKANLKIAYGINGFKSDHAEYVFYIIPWQLLSVAVPALIIVLIVLRWIIKRYNRYIIRQAQKRIENQSIENKK